MKKSKKSFSRLLFGVVLLTLISCCFLGNTFARYLSTGSGTGSVSVAKWSVSHGEGEIAVDFGKLSPSKEAYVDSARSHTSDKVKVATLSNDGEVSALVTLTIGDTVLSTTSSYTTYTEEVVKGLFSFDLYYSTETDSAEAATSEYTTEVELDSGAKMYIYATVTWTSDDDSTTGEDADARDTWVGQNVTSVGTSFSYTAVQNSELPSSQA